MQYSNCIHFIVMRMLLSSRDLTQRHKNMQFLPYLNCIQCVIMRAGQALTRHIAWPT